MIHDNLLIWMYISVTTGRKTSLWPSKLKTLLEVIHETNNSWAFYHSNDIATYKLPKSDNGKSRRSANNIAGDSRSRGSS